MSYKSPGIDVLLERRQVDRRSSETQFYPVFVGTGLTSRNRNIQKSNLRADTSEFPNVKINFDLTGSVNADLFNETAFTMGQVTVTKSSGSTTQQTLEFGEGYELVQNVSASVGSTDYFVIIKVTNVEITAADLIYEINITASNADKDFDLRTIGADDRFFSRDMFGPIILKENDVEFYNDIAIAAEIAFRMEVPRFYYLEVPRNYGERPTLADYKMAVDKAYFVEDAYRLVALTSEAEIHESIKNFVAGVSNPVDRRETVAFITYDTSNIEDMNNIDELVEKVGGYSRAIDHKRVCNVFGGSSVEMRINNQVYVLPEYFQAVAVVALDAVVGRVDPLSLREINVFERINGPRFRPRQWDKLAQAGVFILQKDNPAAPAVIRHQLTTSQSNLAEDQEYSVVKNFDVVTKKIRDRFKPYAGQSNIDTGYTERLEGTLASVRQEIIEENLARELTVITPWSQREGGDGRNLVTRLRMEPVFPANHLEVYLIV